MQVSQANKPLCVISINPTTGEVWNIHTGQVIGILQLDSFMFIPYSGRYAELPYQLHEDIDTYVKKNNLVIQPDLFGESSD